MGECFSLMENKMKYGEFIYGHVASAMMGAALYMLFGWIGVLIVLSTLLFWGILKCYKEVEE